MTRWRWQRPRIADVSGGCARRTGADRRRAHVSLLPNEVWSYLRRVAEAGELSVAASSATGSELSCAYTMRRMCNSTCLLWRNAMAAIFADVLESTREPGTCNELQSSAVQTAIIAIFRPNYLTLSWARKPLYLPLKPDWLPPNRNHPAETTLHATEETAPIQIGKPARRMASASSRVRSESSFPFMNLAISAGRASNCSASVLGE
jgi:hypothetical protein